MEYLYRSHRVPDVIVGDFDSVGTEALAYFKTLPGVTIQKLIPEKDDTDTESAKESSIVPPEIITKCLIRSPAFLPPFLKNLKYPETSGCFQRHLR